MRICAVFLGLRPVILVDLGKDALLTVVIRAQELPRRRTFTIRLNQVPDEVIDVIFNFGAFGIKQALSSARVIVGFRVDRRI